ncbi:MAG: cysteine peptidase family C39 domain-containing protein [bacterium]
MGVKQEKRYSCGPAALKNALAFLGRDVEEIAVRKVAGAHWVNGTAAEGIMRAARKFGLNPVQGKFRDFGLAYRALKRHTFQGHPCILCVDNWDHWVTVLDARRDTVTLLDSEYEPRSTTIKPRSLDLRWRRDPYSSDSDRRYQYYFIALKPTGKPGHRRPRPRFDQKTAIRIKNNEELREYWSIYREDLEDIFGKTPSRAGDAAPAFKFIKKNKAQLTNRLAFWDGEVPALFIKNDLRNLIAVARAYRLTVRPAQEKRALADLLLLLFFYWLYD